MPTPSAITSLEEETEPDDLILDLGTKRGDQLEDCSGTVVGIDIDASKFRPRESQVRFVLGDGRELPFASNSFDYVYCGAVLEHVNGSEELITEAARVLAPDGTAYFGFPNRLSLLRPHAMVPRYYSLLPKALGRRLAPLVLSVESTEYYEVGLFPLTPLTARRHMHANFSEVDYTMTMSGEMVTDSGPVRRLFRGANKIATKPPFKWPYELFWPNASYRCERPSTE